VTPRDAEICLQRRGGKTVRAIARSVGLPDHTVGAILRKNGMTSKSYREAVRPTDYKPGHNDSLIERGKCLNCRLPFRGHSRQFLCYKCQQLC